MNRIFLLFIFFIPLFFTDCQSNHASTGPISDIKEYPVTKLIALDTFYFSEYVSEIISKQNIEIRARVKGFLEEIHVDEGKFVEKGKAMFQISDDEYYANLAKMNANLKNVIAEKKAVELDLQRVKTLVDSNVISKTEYNILQAKLESLNARIEEEESNIAYAKVILSYTSIKAPFNGITNRIPLKVGSLVDEGTLLTTLSDNSEVFAYFKVSEREYLDYVANQQEAEQRSEAALVLADGTPHKHKGHVETIEGEFDNTIGSIAFRARFPNPNRILKHGSSGKIRLTRKLKNAVLIPQKATFDIQDKHYVFVVDSNNKVLMKNFVTEQRISHFYVVESGLQPHDCILYEGIQSVRDSMIIKPKFISMKDILKETH